VGRTSFRVRRHHRRSRRPRRRVTEIKSAAFKCSTENSNSASKLSSKFELKALANLLSVAGLTRKETTVGAYASEDPAPVIETEKN